MEKAPTTHRDTENLQKLLDVNVKGIYFSLREELTMMLEHGEGELSIAPQWQE